MNEDSKQRFILMLAIGMTAMLLMQFFFKPKPEAPAPTRPVATAPAPVQPQQPQATGTGTSVAAGRTESADFQPDADYTVTVRVGEAGKNAHGYEAAFSSVGASLVKYRLLGYYRVPMNEEPDNLMVLLDRMAPGYDSLMVESIVTGKTRAELARSILRGLRYELIEAPADAVIAPEPEGDVVRGDNKLVFRAVVGDWELRKTFTFPVQQGSAPDFTVGMDIEWRNLADVANLLSYNLVGPAGLIPDDDSPQFGIINILSARQPSASSDSVDIERTALSSLAGIKAEGGREPMSDPDNRAGLAWIGAKNRFFTAIMIANPAFIAQSNGANRRLFPGVPGYIPTAKDLVDNMKPQPHINTANGSVPAFGETQLVVDAGSISPGGSYQASYMLYAGPAVDEYMEKADTRLHGVVSYTIASLDFISRLLVRLLTFLDGIFGNYGLAIIAVTIIIKALLHPLNRKTFVSMTKMSKLAPRMKEVQKKYANDRARMQQEMSKFYKENGVSMAGGCLPMLLQLPIFFALYGAFSQGFSMRHAAFIPGWIQDLSKPDSIYDLGFNIPLLGWNQVSLLPIIYVAMQLVQMSMQPKPSDPQQAQQQKIMKLMPLMFMYIFYTMPAGLVLYFTVSALTGVAESWWMRKYLLPKLGLSDKPETAGASDAAPAAQAGTGAAPVPSEAKKRKRKK